MQTTLTHPILASISRIGDSWQLNWDGQTDIVGPYRGLFYLSLLVHRPNQSFPADVLFLAASGSPLLTESQDVALRNRIRVPVKRTIDKAVREISRSRLPKMADHLKATILSGCEFSYRPQLDGGQVAWQ